MPLQFSATSIEVITTLALVVWYIMTPSTKVYMGEGRDIMKTINYCTDVYTGPHR